MPAKWLRGIGFGAAVLPLLLLTRADLNAADKPAAPRSHPTPAVGVSETASFSPPSMAAFLDIPVPQGSLSGTTSGDRPLAVTLDLPRAAGESAPPRTLSQVAFQAYTQPTVSSVPPPGTPQRMPSTTMPRVVEPPMTPVPSRTLPIPTTPTSQTVPPMTDALGQPTPMVPMPTPVMAPHAVPGMPVVDHDIWYSEGDACGDSCCGSSCGCGPMRRMCSGLFDCCGGSDCDAPFEHVFFASAEYMMLFIKSSDYPALANQTIPGMGPLTVLGGSSLNRDEFSGARFRFGLWCDEHHLFGIEGSYFGMGDATNQANIASPGGLPTLSVPLVNADTVIGGTVGGVAVSGSIQSAMRTQFGGADANFRRNWLLGQNWHVDGLAGFRYLGLQDDFTFVTQRTFANGLSATTNDQIRTRNRFYGGQIGAVAEYEIGAWTLGVRSTSAFGYNYQMIDTSGSLRTNVGVNNANGLLTAGNNRQDSRSRAGFVQEVTATVGLQLTDCLRLTGGYNILYWNNVVRPGEQIDVVRNVPGRPAFNRQTTDFWAQGFTLGLEFRY